MVGLDRLLGLQAQNLLQKIIGVMEAVTEARRHDTNRADIVQGQRHVARQKMQVRQLNYPSEEDTEADEAAEDCTRDFLAAGSSLDS